MGVIFFRSPPQSSGSASNTGQIMTDKDKGKPYLRVVKDTDRLTAKQEAFCQGVADGKMLVDAYRDAGYMPNGSAKTQWEAASRLMSGNSKVMARVQAIQADREQEHRTRTARREEYVLKRLQEEAEGAETDGARVRALELLGKTVGIFTDKVEIEQDGDKSAAELEADLERRLAALLGD